MTNPLTAPIDRALLSTVPHFDRARIRDAILANIEDEFGPVRVDQRSDLGARIVSEWRSA